MNKTISDFLASRLIECRLACREINKDFEVLGSWSYIYQMILGIGLTILVITINSTVGKILPFVNINSFIIAPLVEEGAKYIATSTLTTLGFMTIFSLAEYFMYVSNFYPIIGAPILLMRLAPLLMHVYTMFLHKYYMYLSKYARDIESSHNLRMKGFMICVLIHSIYNISTTILMSFL